MIEKLGSDVGTVNGKATPAEAKLFFKYTDGEVAHSDFSYNIVVVVMLYFYCHSRPDIAYSANCAACNMFFTRHSHEVALKRIGRYLKSICSRGLILNPSFCLKIYCYPDADFTGMNECEKLSKE